MTSRVQNAPRHPVIGSFLVDYGSDRLNPISVEKYFQDNLVKRNMIVDFCLKIGE